MLQWLIEHCNKDLLGNVTMPGLAMAEVLITKSLGVWLRSLNKVF